MTEETANVEAEGIAITLTEMAGNMAKARYERYDSHYVMPGGFTWDQYLEEDPDAAEQYLQEAREDLMAAFGIDD